MTPEDPTVLDHLLGVRRIGFGSMQLTGSGVWGPHPHPDTCVTVLRRAADLGATFFDTADSYGPGIAEELIARALWPYPAELVIATKGGMRRPAPGVFVPDGRPHHLRNACEGSLQRLRLECIPLYQLHTPDPLVPFDESIGALVRLREEGKIAQIGVCNVTVSQMTKARAVANVVSVQNEYNLGRRMADPVLRLCEKLGIAFIPWFPLATGHLARRGGALERIGRRHAATPAQIAIAWLLSLSPIMLPIPGTSSLAHLEENVAAASLVLDASDLAALNRASVALQLRERIRRFLRRT